MNDLERRIRAAIANLEEEFSTVVIMGLPADKAGCPVIVHNGDQETAWALAKLGERLLRNDRTSPQQN
jgi:hypothetical protein